MDTLVSVCTAQDATKQHDNSVAKILNPEEDN